MVRKKIFTGEETLKEMNDRERFLNVMNYKPVDRCVYGVGTGAWPETIERWKIEGYDPDNPPRFDIDHWEWQGGWFFPNPPFEKKTLSEDAETVLFINHEGITMRERKDNPMSSMPQFMKFPVETRAEFHRFHKERMQPNLAARIGADYAEKLSAFRNRTFPLMVISDRWGGFFGGLRAMVGVERLCLLFYEDPAFVEEMMDATADFIIAMMGKILYPFEAQCGMDVVKVWPLVEEGGYVPGLDHSMPPDVPFKNYLYYIEHLKKIL